MNAEHVSELIKAGLPDADVKVEDMRGDGSAFTAVVKCARFAGMNRIQQHRMVYSTLDNHIGTDIHALRLETHAA